MQSGFCRFYADVDDIMLDIPHVHAQLEKMVSRVAQRNLISNKVRLQCPNRYVNLFAQISLNLVPAIRSFLSHSFYRKYTWLSGVLLVNTNIFVSWNIFDTS